uniref:Beta/gamma crystallin 'Greek key' domain-containing protein n=1 Tax=Xenopus tropicalis TaxID=8364 RepID=A0A1B8XYD8_XENTR
MSNILELFSEPNLKGDSVKLKADSGDLSSVGFLKRAQSLRVVGDPWIVFTGTQYQGEFTHYKEGSCNIPGFANEISSVRVVPGGILTPKITLYEHIKYGGRAVTLEKAAESLKSYGFDNMISSHKTESGAWILYDGEHYRGSRMVTVAGDRVPNYVPLGWNDRVSSVRPITDTWDSI